jgi:hypothetical protein
MRKDACTCLCGWQSRKIPLLLRTAKYANRQLNQRFRIHSAMQYRVSVAAGTVAFVKQKRSVIYYLTYSIC